MAVTFAKFHVGQTFETLPDVEEAIISVDEARLVRPTRPDTVEEWRAYGDVIVWLHKERVRLTPSICESRIPAIGCMHHFLLHVWPSREPLSMPVNM